MSVDMDIPVGLINKWWLQREDIRTQFERYCRAQEHQEKLFQQSLNGHDKPGTSRDMDEEPVDDKDEDFTPDNDVTSKVDQGSDDERRSPKRKKKKPEPTSPFKRRKRVELPSKTPVTESPVTIKEPKDIVQKPMKMKGAKVIQKAKRTPGKKTPKSKLREQVKKMMSNTPSNKDKIKRNLVKTTTYEVKENGPDQKPSLRVISPKPLHSVRDAPRLSTDSRRSSTSSRSSTPKPPVDNIPLPKSNLFSDKKSSFDSDQSFVSASSTSFNSQEFKISKLLKGNEDDTNNFKENDNIRRALDTSQESSLSSLLELGEPDKRSMSEEPSQLSLPAPSSSLSISSNVNNYQQSFPVSSQIKQSPYESPRQNIPVSTHPTSHVNQFQPQTISSSSLTPFSTPISISSSSCNSSVDTNLASAPIKAVNIKKEQASSGEYIEDTTTMTTMTHLEANVANKYYSHIGSEPTPAVASAPLAAMTPAMIKQEQRDVSIPSQAPSYPSSSISVNHYTAAAAAASSSLASSTVNIKAERPEREQSVSPPASDFPLALVSDNDTINYPGYNVPDVIVPPPVIPSQVSAQSLVIPDSPRTIIVNRGRGRGSLATRGRGQVVMGRGQPVLARGRGQPIVHRGQGTVVRGPSAVSRGQVIMPQRGQVVRGQMNPRGQPIVRGPSVVRGQIAPRGQPITRGQRGQPVMRGQPLVRGASVIRGQPAARGPRGGMVNGPIRAGPRPMMRPVLNGRGGPMPVRGRGGPVRGSVRPPAPAPAPLPEKLANMNGLSIIRQKPVELPKNVNLPSGITLSHPRGIQNQPPPPRPSPSRPPQQPSEGPKKKVTMELSQRQIDALKKLGML